MLGKLCSVKNRLYATAERQVADGDQATTDRTLEHRRGQREEDRQSEASAGLGCVERAYLSSEVVLARVAVANELSRLGDEVLICDFEAFPERGGCGLVE